MKRKLALVLAVTTFGSSAFAEPSDSLTLNGDHTQGSLPFGTADEASGTARASVPLEFPPGRRGALPRLALTYRHTGGASEVGEGWSLGLPAIERRAIAGGSAPSFANDDQFYYAGQRLILVGTVPGATYQGEPMPSWAAGWTLYRPMVERGNTRVFRSSGGNTWRAQLPDGGLLEFGTPLLIGGANQPLDLDKCTAARVVRWKLVLDSDSDVITNPVVYRWASPDCNRPALLTDVYYTHSPAAGIANLDAYANHVQLNYKQVAVAPLANQPPPAGLRASPSFHVERIGIASREASSSGSRERVRSYRFEYLPMRGGRPFLRRVATVGRCVDPGASVESPVKPLVGEQTNSLPDDAGCPARPPWEFTYSQDFAPQPTYSGGAVVGSRYLPNGEVAATLYEAPASNVSLLAESGGAFDPELEFDHVSLTDINRDGFPDIVNSAQRRALLAHGPLDVFAGGAVTFSPALLANSTQGAPAFAQTGNEPIFWRSAPGLTIAGRWADGRFTEFVSRPSLAPDAPAEQQQDLPRRLLRIEGTGNPSFQLREVATDAFPAVNSYTGVSAFAPHSFGDINGDGLTDALISDGYSHHMWVALSKRTPTGITTLSSPTPSNLMMGNSATAYSALVDMNGDGYADYVTAVPNGWFYYPGHGDGTFRCLFNWTPCSSIAYTGAAYGVYADISYNQSSFGIQLNDVTITPKVFQDVTGDGRADAVELVLEPSPAFRVQVNLDGMRFAPPVSIPFVAPLNAEVSRFLVADMNASGIDDMVVLGRSDGVAVDFQHNQIPGLLVHVRAPEGSTTEYEYDTVQRESAREGAFGGSLGDPSEPMTGPWQNRSPVPAYIVKKVTTRSGAPAPYARTLTTQFDYRDAVFDTWRSELRGFRRTRAITGTVAVDTRYIFGGCLTHDGELPDTSGPIEERCTTPDIDPYDALNGSPYQVDRYSWGLVEVEPGGQAPTLAGTRLSTTFTTHYATRIGLNRWHVYPSESNTFLYDPTAAGQSTSKVLTYAQFEVDGAVNPRSATVQLSGVPCASEQDTTGCTVRIRERTGMLAPGLPFRKYFDGRVSLEDAPIDRPIKVDYQYVTVSQPGIYRLSLQQVTFAGQGAVPSIGPDAPVKTTVFDWDARGRLSKISAVAGGALALQRFHETGQAVAPEPPTAVTPSMTSPIALQTLTYDGNGNLSKVVGGEGECFNLQYDPSYADLLYGTWSFAGTCNVGQRIDVYTNYDRGLGALRSTTRTFSPSHYYYYDGFGRLTRSSRAGFGLTEAEATTLATLDHTDANAFGISMTHTVTPEREGWAFTDSFGAAILSIAQADPGVGDEGDWVAQPGPIRRNDGQVAFAATPFFWSGDPSTFYGTSDFTSMFFGNASTAESREYDAHGRLYRVRSGYNGRLISQYDSHPLSSVTWNAESLDPASAHYGRFARTQLNGFGEAIRTETFDDLGYQEITQYDHTAFGAVNGIRRMSTGSGTEYRRWMRFDALGNMVENAEPNTATGFSPNPAGAPDMKSWRYAYDKSRRLVGTRDARGCGKNISYDRFSRPLAEDYSPCKAHHPAYTSSPEAKWQWDSVEAGQTSDYGNGTLLLKGRLAAYRDRGTWNRYGYDGLGRQISLARRIVAPRGQSPIAANAGYDDTWFRKSYQYDALDRLTSESSGANVPELLGVGGTSAVEYAYSQRGLLKRIGSSYGDLVSAIWYNALGRPTRQRFGDTAETTTTITYDPVEHWVNSWETSRQAPSLWTAPPQGYTPPADGFGIQTTVRSESFARDGNGNITGIADPRNPEEWPAGAKPVSRSITYDAHFRASQVSYQHGGDDQVSPFLAEEQANDPRPFPRTVTSSRVGSQLLAHDALGNLDVAVGDTSGSVLERGFGSAQMSPSAPHQIVQTNSTDGSHSVTPHYDEAGNIVGIDVSRVATCSAPTSKCAQRFLFEWDEVGSLVRARRWDMYSLQDEPSYPAEPNGPVAAEARYRYSAGQRVHKESIEGGVSSFTADVFASLRLKNTTWDNVTGTYRVDASTASVDLGVARVVSRPGLPGVTGDQHTLLFLPDHLGSTSTVIDKGTSEIAEMVTYLPHGGTETDFRPERWQGLREDLRFSGREEDVEFGIIAMGVRAYSPMLGRFMSADPLTIHGVAGDINPYGYVGGSVLNMIDPSGLDGWCIGVCETGGNGDGSSNRDGSGPGRDAAGPPPNSGGGGGSAGGGGNGRTPVSHATGPTYRPSPAPASGTAGGFVASLRSAHAAALRTVTQIDDAGYLRQSEAAIHGFLKAIPLTPNPLGPTLGSALDAVGIKSDHRAQNTELVASIVGPVAVGAVGAAAERVAIRLGTAAAEGLLARSVATTPQAAAALRAQLAAEEAIASSGRIHLASPLEVGTTRIALFDTLTGRLHVGSRGAAIHDGLRQMVGLPEASGRYVGGFLKIGEEGRVIFQSVSGTFPSTAEGLPANVLDMVRGLGIAVQ